ncbi:MAG: hypothetical protein J5630_07870, partial [Bacteroidaceae bacterium]|nr:hypothetical protein [Bacteroidaceae bacterium]
EQGALFLLQLTNNKILYRNISRDPKRHGEFIEFKIKRYLQYRLQDLTHEEVQDMQRKVDSIAAEHALDKATSSPEGDKEALSEGEQFRAGKRADHDTLPPEVQALFVENANIMRKIREVHMQLRNLSTQASTCPDSDRYPFLKELIELDKRYHHNWQEYDNYSAASPEATNSSKAEVILAEETRQEQKNILRQVNLTKGRYKKNPSAELKDKLASLYEQLTAPSDKLTAELKELGVI